jgi:hypothetical protein
VNRLSGRERIIGSLQRDPRKEIVSISSDLLAGAFALFAARSDKE